MNAPVKLKPFAAEKRHAMLLREAVRAGAKALRGARLAVGRSSLSPNDKTTAATVIDGILTQLAAIDDIVTDAMQGKQ